MKYILIIFLFVASNIEIYSHGQTPSEFSTDDNNSVNITTPVKYDITNNIVNYGIDANFIFLLFNAGISYQFNFSESNEILSGTNVNFGIGFRYLQFKLTLNLNNSVAGYKFVSEWILFNEDSPHNADYSDKWWKSRDGMLLNVSFEIKNYESKKIYFVGIGCGFYFNFLNV